MKLRLLTPDDESEALLAHEELAGEGFEFLLGYQPRMDWDHFLEATEDTRNNRNIPAGWVPATFLIAEDDDGNIVGRVSIRHQLNDFLRIKGGHIGYGVRPQCRGRGYATLMLRQALITARGVGIENALVTCDADNEASKATIVRNGGFREGNDDDGTLRFWIRT